MPWVEPITDRTADDILNRTAKAFLNVADWTRIYENSQIVNQLLVALFGWPVQFDVLTAPVITTFPSAANINALVGNIECSRLASGLPQTNEQAPLKTNWGEGLGAKAPNYPVVNLWEQTLKTIYEEAPKTTEYMVFAGVANVGQSRSWQNRFRKPITSPGDLG